jgi:hypothetical protein
VCIEPGPSNHGEVGAVDLWQEIIAGSGIGEGNCCITVRQNLKARVLKHFGPQFVVGGHIREELKGGVKFC